MKLFFLISLLTLGTFATPLNKETSSAAIYARSSIVMEVETNKVLYSNNIHAARSVASVSKIMTAIVAIENSKLDKVVVIPEEIKKAVGSMIYVKVGDRLTLEELIYGLMLRSGNDAAVSIAVAVSGSVEQFVEKMNLKAKELKMNNSLFRNPHGLDEFDGGNLSTAFDLALLMAYSVKNPIFKQIAGTKSYKVQSLNTTWGNKNRLLSQYQYTTGGKTGYTKIAKRTLVTSAKKDETELVVVTIDCGGDFSLHKQLYEIFFAKFKTKLLVKQGEQYIDNYKVKFEKNFYYLEDANFWKDAALLIEINHSSKQADIILHYKSERIIIGHGKIIEEIVPKKQSFWQKILNIFK